MFKFFKGKDGKNSLTIIAGAVVATAGVIVSLPAGIVPVAVVVAAKIVGAVAISIGAKGVKNAIDKSGK